MDRINAIEQRLRQVFTPENLEVSDESQSHVGHEGAKGGGGHYAVTIVSDRFRGKTPVMRHRMIYDALNELMNKEIHALRITALSPDEF